MFVRRLGTLICFLSTSVVVVALPKRPSANFAVLTADGNDELNKVILANNQKDGVHADRSAVELRHNIKRRKSLEEESKKEF